MPYELQIVMRLGLAAFLGGCIGIERELRHKPIGLRTNILIATTGAMVMVLAAAIARPAGDSVPRLAAALIQGLGFIGAGAIMRERGSVKGITTASVLMLVTGVGLSAGAGAWLLAVSSTALTLIVLTGFGRLERAIHTKCESVTYVLQTAEPERMRDEIDRLFGDSNAHLHDVRFVSEGDAQRVEFSACGSDELAQSLVVKVQQLQQRARPSAGS